MDTPTFDEAAVESVKLALRSTILHSDAADFRQLVESGGLELIADAVRELKPQAVLMVTNALEYVTSLENERKLTAKNTARGQIAVQALKACWQEIMVMLNIADDPSALEDWTTSIDAILQVSTAQVSSEIAEAKRRLVEFQNQLSATSESAEGGRRLVVMLPIVARIVSATSVGVSLGAAISNPVTSLVCTVITTSVSEATRAGIDTWLNRDPYKLAHDAHELLMTAVSNSSDLMMVAEVRYLADQWVADVRLRFAIHGTQNAIVSISWPNKLPYRDTLDEIPAQRVAPDEISTRRETLTTCRIKLDRCQPPPSRRQ